MKIADFDYPLPNELIAIYPSAKRGDTRLLVINRKEQSVTSEMYTNLDKFVESDDLVVINNTKVIKARLKANKTNGAKVEIFLIEKHSKKEAKNNQYAIYKGDIQAGDVLTIQGNRITIKAQFDGGEVEIESDTDLYQLAEKHGEVPIPPYLKRKSERIDEERYQTEFAHEKGSVAAPTASLNFTNELRRRIENKGAKIIEITLHVGLGTFLPVREENVEDHQIHSEFYTIPREAVCQIQKAKKYGRHIFAIGTTVTRALESAAALILNDSSSDEISQEAQIFIYPGYKFKIIDHLLTNFHAPRSTVLLLAAAFTGKDLLQKAYQKAVNEKYQFLSYGDSMLIL